MQHKSFFYLNQDFPISEKLWENIKDEIVISFLKEKYKVIPEKREILPENFNLKIPNSFYPIILNYLKKRETLLNNRVENFISPKFKEDWSLFFRGVHSLKEELVLSSIKTIDDLKEIANYFNGKNLEYADFSFYLEPLKGVKIAYLYWKGDEEFPPSLTILFDEILTKIFMQDFVWGVVVEVNSRIKNFNFYKEIFPS